MKRLDLQMFTNISDEEIKWLTLIIIVYKRWRYDDFDKTRNEFLKSLLTVDVYRRIENHLEEQVKFTGEVYIKFTHFINITYTPDRKSLSTLDEKLSKDHISYVLIQVKNWSTDNKGDDYLLSTTASLSPAYIGIEELPHMPFLSLYLQLGATKEFIDVPTEFFESPQTYYQTDDDEARENFIKKIRIDDNNDASNAEITAFCEHFQMPLALFGLSSNIYSCLKQFTSNPTTSSLDFTSSFKQLLTAWVDPTLGECPEKMKIIKHMEPLVYKME
nr:1751_t:CDS:2 [Entrophospora candida]